VWKNLQDAELNQNELNRTVCNAEFKHQNHNYYIMHAFNINMIEALSSPSLN